MKKKLIVLMAMLMMVLSVTSPALAESTAASSVAATGTLAEIADHPYASHGIRDEASGAEYLLRSNAVSLYSYNGKRVTVYGTYASADTSSVSGDMSASSKAENEPRLVDVYRVEPAIDPGQETVTATFKLAVEGEPPAGTVFAGSIGAGPAAYGALQDEDGDGVYTTTLPVEQGEEHEVRIEQATPLNDDPYAPLVPSTIKNFGSTEFDEDETFSAKVSFKNGNGGTGNDGSSNGGGKFLSNVAGGAKGLLPSTGGGEALTLLGGGALLIVGGLILRKLVWR